MHLALLRTITHCHAVNETILPPSTRHTGIITRKLIRCGTFSSVKALNKAIESFVAHWNSDCGPIVWTATAEEILDKVRTITSRMEALLRATEIDDVARHAA
jgi:hypothetical protein